MIRPMCVFLCEQDSKIKFGTADASYALQEDIVQHMMATK